VVGGGRGTERKFPIGLSLGIIGALIGGSIAASLLFAPRNAQEPPA